MPPSLATPPRRHFAITNAIAIAGAVGLAACASAPAPATLTDEQIARCREVEIAYRTDAPDYAAKRDALARDELAARWLVRMFVADVVAGREVRAVDEGTQSLRAAPRAPAARELAAALQQLRAEDARAARGRLLETVAADEPSTNATAAAGRGTGEQRALAEIVSLGAIAVPVLVHDLLEHEHSEVRELGAELLARVGAPAVPALQRIARAGDAKQRRVAALALGHIGIDADVLATLRALATDGDYTVRADALRGLTGGGADAEALLVERLRADDDAFVRRVAAQTLGHFRTPTAAAALVDYLERTERESDRDGERAAQSALMAIADTRRLRTTAAWRAWAAALGTGAPRAPGNSLAPR